MKEKAPNNRSSWRAAFAALALAIPAMNDAQEPKNVQSGNDPGHSESQVDAEFYTAHILKGDYLARKDLRNPLEDIDIDILVQSTVSMNKLLGAIVKEKTKTEDEIKHLMKIRNNLDPKTDSEQRAQINTAIIALEVGELSDLFKKIIDLNETIDDYYKEIRRRAKNEKPEKEQS